MKNIIKVIVASVPIFALIFYYVTTQQAKLDAEIDKDQAVFEREWSEFKADFRGGRGRKAEYEARAAEAEKRRVEAEKRVAELQKESEAVRLEMGRQLEAVRDSGQSPGKSVPDGQR
jgi:hypothetical protein